MSGQALAGSRSLS